MHYKVIFSFEGEKKTRAVEAVNLLDVFSQLQANFPGATPIYVQESTEGPGGYFVPGKTVYGEPPPQSESVRPMQPREIALLLQQGVIPPVEDHGTKIPE